MYPNLNAIPLNALPLKTVPLHDQQQFRLNKINEIISLQRLKKEN